VDDEREMLAMYEREMGCVADEVAELVDPHAVDQYGVRYDDVCEASGRSWVPRDLTSELAGNHERRLPTMLVRSDGVGLLYPGTINGFHADSGIGKSLVAQVAAREHLDAGGHVWWFDFEDANERLLIERLRLLEVADHTIAERVHYLNPDEPASLVHVSRLLGTIAAYPRSLAVIDSVGEALGLQGLDENKDLDVDRWKRLLPHELERAGHTVTVIDHSTKASDNPLYPSGSKRKRALISGSAWLLESVVPFDRQHPGKLKLVCAKDRHGNYRRGDVGAWVHVDPTGDHLQIFVEAPSTEDTSPRPITVLLVNRVVDACRSAGQDGLTLRKLRAAIRARGNASNQAVDDAAELAESIAAITITDGPRGARVHRWARDPSTEELQELVR
jgi:hypothetical protein